MAEISFDLGDEEVYENAMRNIAQRYRQELEDRRVPEFIKKHRRRVVKLIERRDNYLPTDPDI